MTISIPLDHRKLIFKDNTLQKGPKKESLIKKKKKSLLYTSSFPKANMGKFEKFISKYFKFLKF